MYAHAIEHRQALGSVIGDIASGVDNVLSTVGSIVDGATSATTSGAGGSSSSSSSSSSSPTSSSSSSSASSSSSSSFSLPTLSIPGLTSESSRTSSSPTSTSSSVTSSSTTSSSFTPSSTAESAQTTTFSSAGQMLTVTNFVTQPVSSSSSPSPSPSAGTPTGGKSFLENKPLSGAVIGMGSLIGLALVLFIGTFFIRRRRRQRLTEEAVSFDPSSHEQYRDELEQGLVEKRSSSGSHGYGGGYGQYPTAAVTATAAAYPNAGYYNPGNGQGYGTQGFAAYSPPTHSAPPRVYHPAGNPPPIVPPKSPVAGMPPVSPQHPVSIAPPRSPMTDSAPSMSHVMDDMVFNQRAEGDKPLVRKYSNVSRVPVPAPLPKTFGPDDDGDGVDEKNSDDSYHRGNLKVANYTV